MSDECTCEWALPEWVQDPDCPVHPMTKAEEAPRHKVGITEIPINLVGPWLRVAALIYPGSTVTTPQGAGLALQLNLGEADRQAIDDIDEALSRLEEGDHEPW
jgi:hypothetical protein